LVVNDAGISAVELECHAPIATDPNGLVPCKLTFQGMQLPARNVHVTRQPSLIELGELAFQSGCMRRLYARFAARRKEGFQAFVDEALDHEQSV
jgi:hypothetical protein